MTFPSPARCGGRIGNQERGSAVWALPIRCLACRRRLRSGRALYQAVERAKAALGEAPQDPALKLAVAEALVRLKEPTGQGNLDEVIRLARSAARAADTTAAQRAEAAFWEGKAQAVAGRERRARELLTLALTALPSSKRGIALRSEAKWWLEPRS